MPAHRTRLLTYPNHLEDASTGHFAAFVLAPLVAVPLGTARSVAAGALANCLGIHALEAIQVHELPFRSAGAPRATLIAPVEHVGVGLHGGRPCRACIRPAPVGFGRCINGTPATLAHVVDDRLATTLGTATGPVVMVEHLLAALVLAGIDDADITVEGGEVPILDGSAAPWLAGLQPRFHGGARAIHVIQAPLQVEDGASLLTIEPAEAFEIAVEIDFPGLGPQRVAGDLAAARAWAGARTFGFAADAERLYAAGRALGAGLENTVVFEADGRCLNPEGLRWPDEAVRHKALDLLGDLALLGADIQGRVRAVRAGHRLHHALVRALSL